MRPFFLIVLGALAGCTVGPDHVTPAMRLPEAWNEATGFATNGTADEGQFWRTFHDPVLDQIEQLAVQNNPDIEVARARVAEARMLAAAAGSERWPKVDLTASYSNSRLSEHGFIEGLGSGSPGGSGGAIFPGQQIDLHQVGVDASWEIDLFGGRRRSVEASEATAEAATTDARGVLLALRAGVADEYLQWCGIQERLQIVRDHRKVELAELEIRRERALAGVGDTIDVASGERALAEQDAALQGMLGEQQASQHRLERLVGAMPGELATTLRAASRLPAQTDPFAIDVPAIVLRRRPDVAAAELRLHAATATIGIATADLYPRISLTGPFGLQAQQLPDLGNYDSRFWAIGPQLRWPLFDFGRVNARIATADARAKQALATYRGTVLESLADTEIALVRVQRCQQELAARQRAMTAATTQHELATEQFERGVGEYLAVLEMQRVRLEAAESLRFARLAMAHDVVALGKALGGSFADAEVFRTDGAKDPATSTGR
jgi:outer membrane protein, multidrug efflux system